MAKRVFNGLTELRNYLKTIESTKNSVFILFTGSKDDNGKSWCPDCNTADPIIEKNLEFLKPNSQFLTCFVGDRPTWKNPEHELRKDKEFQLKRIPALIQWKKNKVLYEEQCADDSLLKMLFGEEDDE